MRSIAIAIATGATLGACAEQTAPTAVARVDFSALAAQPVATLQHDWGRDPDSAMPAMPAPAGESVRTSVFVGELALAASSVATQAAPWMESFYEKVTSIDLQVRTTSNRAAVRWVLEGQVEAALIAGPPTRSELDQGALARPVTDLTLAVVAHPSVEFSNIDLSYLKQLLTGTIDHWSWVGSDAGHVALVLPKPGKMAGFVARAFIPGDALTDKSIRYADETEGLLQVRQTPGALGVFRLATIQDVEGVRLLHVDGRTPGAKFVRGGHYPFGATIYVVTRGAPNAKAQALAQVLSQP